MKKAAPVQQHLNIKEIKDDVVILKNGQLRAVLMTTSLNFALRAESEKEAIIYRYQEFLNSLDFPIQIIVASRKFNIDPYLQTLEEYLAKQKNELLSIQTAEYIDFVRSLTEMTNIMTESFYIVVPYNPSPLAKKGTFKNLLDKLLPRSNHRQEETTKKEEEFQIMKTNLWQRVEFVITTLRGTGIRAIPLKTDELIELFYKHYNLGAKEDLEMRNKDL